VQKSLVFAYVKPELAATGTALEIDILASAARQRSSPSRPMTLKMSG